MAQPMTLRVTVMQALLVAEWAKYAVCLTLSRQRKLHITLTLMAKLSTPILKQERCLEVFGSSVNDAWQEYAEKVCDPWPAFREEFEPASSLSCACCS